MDPNLFFQKCKQQDWDKLNEVKTPWVLVGAASSKHIKSAYRTINDNDMLSYSLTTMMCFLTKEWYGFPAYTVNLFIKAYHQITYKEDLKIT